MGPRYDGHVPTAVARTRQDGVRWVMKGGVSIADVDDVALGTIAALERGRPGERYVLAGHNIEWKEFYSRLAHELGSSSSTIVMPPLAAWTLARATGFFDLFGLSRPPWTPEVELACPSGMRPPSPVNPPAPPWLRELEKVQPTMVARPAPAMAPPCAVPPSPPFPPVPPAPTTSW